MARQSEYMGLTLPDLADFVNRSTEKYSDNFEAIDEFAKNTDTKLSQLATEIQKIKEDLFGDEEG
jgi:hypothetical protein